MKDRPPGKTPWHDGLIDCLALIAAAVFCWAVYKWNENRAPITGVTIEER